MTSRLANALTTLFALLTLVAAGYGIWRFNDMKHEVTEQQARLADQQARLAEIQSAILYAEGATYGLEDLSNRMKGLCGKTPQSTQVKNFCTSQLPSLDAGQLLAEARRARIKAVRAGDYRGMRQAYAKLVAYLQRRPDDSSGWKDGWLALAMEGVAYADLKLGRLPQAGDLIADAAERNGGDASVGATALKIKCVQRAPSDRIASDYAALRTELDKRVASHPVGSEAHRNSVLERDFLSSDVELFHLCAYADLRPPS